MVRILLIILFQLFSIASFAQGLEEMINSNQLVVCATELREYNQLADPVAPGYNFVMLAGDEVTIQWEDQFGNNGQGGFTQVGEIYKQQLKKKQLKNGWKYVSKIKCNAQFAQYELILVLRDDGNAVVTIKGHNGQIQLFGKIYSIENASIILGREQDMRSLRMRNFNQEEYAGWRNGRQTNSEKYFHQQ